MRVAMPFQSYRTNCSAVYSSAVSAATIASFYVGLGTFYTNVSIFFYLSVYLFFRLREMEWNHPPSVSGRVALI